MNFFLFLLPFFFLDNLLCSFFNLNSEFLRYFGLFTLLPLLRAIKLFNPKSIPISLFDLYLIFLLLISTEKHAKYWLALFCFIVNVFTLPFKSLCSFIGILPIFEQYNFSFNLKPDCGYVMLFTLCLNLGNPFFLHVS